MSLQGFKWINEGRPGKADKWGFIGTVPTDEVEVDVPMLSKIPGTSLTVGLGFLVSYEKVGQGLLECVSGCSCPPREYAFWHPWKNSLMEWRTLEVKIDPDSITCTLRVTIVNQSKSEPPSNKVKIMGVMKTAAKGFTMPWLFCEDCVGMKPEPA